MSKQVYLLLSKREKILKDHKQWVDWENRRLRSPVIEYLEQFYARKYKARKLTLAMIAIKVNEILHLPKEARRHIIEHIALVRRPIRKPKHKKDAIRIIKAHPEIKQIRYSKYRRVERDRLNRIHVRDMKTGRFFALTPRRTPKGKMKGR